jgi:hypothetical protein
METKKINKVLVVGVSMAVLLLTLNACSKKTYFNTSSVVPAARGYVKIKKDKNKNYTIDISITDLAEVDRLAGNRKAYVVWMITNNENAKNLGMIDSDTKRFSKKLTASFHSVSATKPTKIFITAEENGSAQYPNNYFVLTTEVI